MTISLAAFDIDGTLAGSDSRVSERTITALTRLGEIMPVAIVTGRVAAAGEAILRRAGLSGHVVGCNGADVRAGERRLRHAMSEELVREVDEYVATRPGVTMAMLGASEIVIEETGVAFDDLVETNDGVPPRIGSLAGLPESERLKAMIHIPRELMAVEREKLRAAFPQAVQTLPTFVEVARPDIDKWTGLSEILQLLDIPAEEVLGIGDSENDIAWLSRIGHPLAPISAYDSVKALCSRHIGHHGDDGVAEFIEQWLEKIS
ncbi:MAG: HAD family hydrolase [Flaviflexus sp.]|nr:HAD family hydrolase [Flaviflexus sp.]